MFPPPHPPADHPQHDGPAPPPGLIAPVAVPAGPRRRLRITGLALGAAVFLVLAVVAGQRARAEQDRPPTAQERAAAAAAAVARRWRVWPSGQVFPASLPYTTGLLNSERAARVAISPGHDCAAALDETAAAAARRDGCRGAIRATYLGQLQGIVYTAGVLAFPDPAGAEAFYRAARGWGPGASLRAYPLAGTGSARFTDAARAAVTARQAGPYVVLVVAGYADGRPASAPDEPRPRVFAPAGALAGEILAPLSRPAVVRCAQRQEWSC